MTKRAKVILYIGIWLALLALLFLRLPVLEAIGTAILIFGLERVRVNLELDDLVEKMEGVSKTAQQVMNAQRDKIKELQARF